MEFDQPNFPGKYQWQAFQAQYFSNQVFSRSCLNYCKRDINCQRHCDKAIYYICDMDFKNLQTFGARLRWARELKKMTQQELAKRVGMGMAQSTIAGYETGARGLKNSAPKELFRIARVVNVNPQWLLTGEGQPQTTQVLDEAIKLLQDMNEDQIKTALRVIEAVNDQKIEK